MAIWRENVGLGAIQFTPPSKAKSAAIRDGSDVALAERPPMRTARSPNWASRLDLAFAQYDTVELMDRLAR
jgi:hypothetical protein